MLYQRRRNESINMVALMAALREIECHQSDAQSLSLQGYDIKPVSFESKNAPGQYDYFDAPAFFHRLPEPAPVIAEKIQAIVAATHETLARAIAEFCADFGEAPALNESISAPVAAEVERILDAPKQETPYNSPKDHAGVGFEDGAVMIDSGALDLPDMVLDPRDGGNYHSEIHELQRALDAVKMVQDWVPASIQSTATDAYNKLTTGISDAGSKT